MGYQAVLKQYEGSIPQKTEVWPLDAAKEEQWKEFDGIPCRLRCRKQEREGETRFLLEAQATQNISSPVSLALEYLPETWQGDEYVFFPAAVYDGNRFVSERLPYPPYHVGGAGGEPVITDIPHLDAAGKPSRIQFCSGDMSTPAMGYYDRRKQEGWLVFAKHMAHGRYTGFTLRQEEKETGFAVSCPAVREKTRYFFGELPDGSGFYPTCEYPSDDEGIQVKAGEELELEVRCFRVPARSLAEYFAGFNELRECMETGETYESIPFSKAYTAVKEKYIRMNFSEEGYLRVGSENEQIPSFWQAGWVGGGMNTYPFLLEDTGEAYLQAVSTLRFVAARLQRPNGWYLPMYAKGKAYGDNFLEEESTVLLVRKAADLLYFLLKQAMYLREHQELPEGLSESIRGQADAFVRFFKKNGELGQFLDMEKETLLQGGTGCGAIAPAALALAYEYFGTKEYIETAEELGNWYCRQCLEQGMLNGGPGEICQAPDSESAFAFLESCVQLYETTGKDLWLETAKEAFELAVTWVMSYDFSFPEESTAGRLGVHSRGTVFANAQNKHSAPGICTLSGNCLLKLYRFTGDYKYLKWLGRISHALSQFVSLKERPVDTLAGRPLHPGYFNERVQTSDWEGKHTVGEFLYGSNWPEVSMLLTYVEVPGVYVDLDRKTVFCCDHIDAELVFGETGSLLRLKNTTPYDAVVTVLADHSQSAGKLGHSYFGRMEKISVKAGQERLVQMDGLGTGNRAEPLTREELTRVIEGKGRARRIPLLYDLWIYDNAFGGDADEYREWQAQYPCDAEEVHLRMPGITEGYAEDENFFWAPPGIALDSAKGLDAQSVLKDWEDEEEIEAFYRTFPDPESAALLGEAPPKGGRYRLGRWLFCYFERLWSLRGMENALTDFFLYPDEVHRLFERLTEFYLRCMERAREEWDVDGFFVTDDIGTQNGPFFSLEIFREFFLPYYKRLIDKAHELGTHFWLHSCGDIRLFLPDFVEIGLDVIHPIQKNTMKEEEIAALFGDQICIFAGIDVQYLMAFGTPEEVRREVEFLIKTYDRPQGRLMLTMGNGSTPDWKRENLDALYEESLKF